MSFGFSVGDVLAVGKLVLDTYNAYKEAPDQFRSISQELHSLHIIVKKVEHQVQPQGQGQNPLDESQQAELGVILEGLQGVLADLDKLLREYHALGSRGGFSFDRLVWGKEDIVGLRERLVSNTTLLTAFNTSLTSCQLAAIQGQLGQLLALQRQASLASFTSSTGSVTLSLRSKAAWKELSRVLHSNNITVPMLHNKLPEILNLFRSAAATDVGGDTDVTKVFEERRKSGRELNFALRRLDAIAGGLLHSAVEREDIEAVRLWSALIADIDYRGAYNRTALHLTAYHSGVECLRLLLEKGANVNAKTNLGLTPLHFAARNGKVECLQLLLEKGATIDIKHHHEWTPLHFAASAGRVECLRILLENDATLDAKTNQGVTPLHFAVINSRVECLRLLLEKGASINAKTNTGCTPLHSAAKQGSVDCLQLLLEKGATIDAQNVLGYSPLHSAATEGDIQCLQLLLDKGAYINILNVYRNSALHSLLLCVYNWNVHLHHEISQRIKILLNHGADIFQQNNDGKTPLDLASELPKNWSWIAEPLHEHVKINNLEAPSNQ